MSKYDLVALIEHDSASTVAPDVAQQQHLCWLLGYVCGVRPGSIGYSRKRTDQYLQWQDIVMTRTGPAASHNFKVQVTFRWLKGYRDEVRRSLVFTCNGPSQTEDVMFSLPHRFLGIMLSRGILADHDPSESLLSGTDIHIGIKEEAAALPVVCASVPKGVGLDLNKPASCDAISAYVQRRALDFGLPAGITHYAWRRSAGTNVAEATSAEKAREFLGHEARSRTFETNYNQGLVAFDAMSIAMGRKPLTAAALLEDECLGTNRIKETTNNRQEWINHYVKSDETYKKLISEVRGYGNSKHDVWYYCLLYTGPGSRSGCRC